MPRKKLIISNELYYHITSRSNHQHWFSTPMPLVWQIAVDSMNLSLSKHQAEVAQFVLMNNHYHLVIKTTGCSISDFMQTFNKSFSDKLRKESLLKNRMFGGRYRFSLISHQSYLLNVYLYVYQNPLRAKIVTACEDYPYSTLWFESRNINCSFKYSPFLSLNADIKSLLNHQLQDDLYIQIQKGFKRSSFKYVYERKY
jgi:putative transposase